VKRGWAAATLLLCLTGCFSARSGAEGFHRRIEKGMTHKEVRSAVGKPKETHPIPGQGNSDELPVEQWRYHWDYMTGKMLTILFTLGIGAFFMDSDSYGFDVGFGRDGRVRTVSEVGPRR